MPKASSSSHHGGIRRIAIDGHFLDEVHTRLHSEGIAKTLSYVSAPVEHHHVTEDETGITVKLPALTALQLYSEGVLTADPHKPVDLSIAGRKLGAFYLHWLRG